MEILMLILTILGALPKLIEFFEFIWKKIGAVKDPQEKAKLRKAARNAVKDSIRWKKRADGLVAENPSPKDQEIDNAAFAKVLDLLSADVDDAIKKDGVKLAQESKALFINAPTQA